jgi:hypothetical protein
MARIWPSSQEPRLTLHPDTSRVDWVDFGDDDAVRLILSYGLAHATTRCQGLETEVPPRPVEVALEVSDLTGPYVWHIRGRYKRQGTEWNLESYENPIAAAKREAEARHRAEVARREAEAKREERIKAALIRRHDLGQGFSLEVSRLASARELDIAPWEEPGYRLFGVLHNSTKKRWDLSVELTVIGQEGQRDTKVLQLADVKPGSNPVVLSIGSWMWRPISMSGKIIRGSYRLKYTLSMVKPVVGRDLSFADRIIGALFMFENNIIRVSLKNNTDDAVTVDWNTVSYVDENGTAHRVFHKDRWPSPMDPDGRSSPPPAVIPPGATLKTFMAPASHVSFRGEVIVRNLLPDGPVGESLNGKELGVFLPLSVKGSQKAYNFRFRIDSVMPE